MVKVRTKRDLISKRSRRQDAELVERNVKLERPASRGIEEMLNKQEMSKLLGVSVGLIDKMVMNGDIPFYKIGRLVRFQKAEVLDRFKNQ